MKAYIAAFAIILFISGCSSFSGEDKFSRSYVSAHIIANKTTESEVKALYGTPDDQSSSSDGSYVWYYDRDGKMDFLSNAVSLIPGASALSGAVTQATIAQHTKDDINSVSDKVSGNTEHRSGRLTIYFTNNKVVSSWYM
ncbi:UNVERIFIED_ORG: PBP1b-binding outer membrane lipoprotein LpoB [Atlantibacter sp. SORGH_AS 304]|nr:PBP1b-binding outer membrane lipoprotein LpoB [Atlantibacter sp. SORGH_AS_0304]